MSRHYFSTLAFAAALLAGATGPAAAVDTSSLSAFLASCPSDAKGCQSMTYNFVATAKDNNYGCIPRNLSADKAADQELDWLKNTARGNPKYEKMDFTDVMWAGIDELWPCHKRN
jgi:hypothetical protein